MWFDIWWKNNSSSCLIGSLPNIAINRNVVIGYHGRYWTSKGVWLGKHDTILLEIRLQFISSKLIFLIRFWWRQMCIAQIVSFLFVGSHIYYKTFLNHSANDQPSDYCRHRPRYRLRVGFVYNAWTSMSHWMKRAIFSHLDDNSIGIRIFH